MVEPGGPERWQLSLVGTSGPGGDDLVQGLREAEARPEDYLRGEPVGRAQEGEVGEGGAPRGDHAAGGNSQRGEGGASGNEELDAPPHPGQADGALPAWWSAGEDRDPEAVGGSGRGSHREGVQQLRKWLRLRRAEDVGLSLPDASILMRGLNKLMKKVLGLHQEMAFRASLVRYTLQLDTIPNHETVKTFSEHLLGEPEQLVHLEKKTKQRAASPG